MMHCFYRKTYNKIKELHVKFWEFCFIAINDDIKIK